MTEKQDEEIRQKIMKEEDELREIIDSGSVDTPSDTLSHLKSAKVPEGTHSQDMDTAVYVGSNPDTKPFNLSEG